MKRVMQALILADKTKLNDDEWKALRRTGIGGSDAAAIVGMNPYATPFSLYADKLGLTPEKEDSEAMRLGRDLEEYVARRFREDNPGKRTKESRFMLRHPKYPWMLANVDRLIIGEQAGLECKTTSVLNLRSFKNGEYPEQYYAQCVHYMAVTGAKRWYLEVLVLGNGSRTFVIERDEDEISALISQEQAFWENNVSKQIPPAADGKSATKTALSQVYTNPNETEIEIRERDVVQNLMALKAEAKALDEQITRCENIIKAELGDSAYGYCGDWRISWKCQSRSSFDVRQFAVDQPKLNLSKYWKTSNFRKFEIKEIR